MKIITLNVSQAVNKLDGDEKLIYVLYIAGQNRETLTNKGLIKLQGDF